MSHPEDVARALVLAQSVCDLYGKSEVDGRSWGAHCGLLLKELRESLEMVRGEPHTRPISASFGEGWMTPAARELMYTAARVRGFDVMGFADRIALANVPHDQVVDARAVETVLAEMVKP